MKKPKILKRPRVFRALESIYDYPLTVVEAPIGYGKTTAVREFLLPQKSPLLWMNFINGENTLSYFWDAFTGQIHRADAEAGERLKSLGFPTDAPQTATVLAILGDIEFDKNTVFVIDDFHYAQGSQIGELLKQIVLSGPDNLHLVVITRDTTGLALAELSAKGLCNIFQQWRLGFTDEEIRSYCVLRGFSLSEDELKKIGGYTGGWISLIYLVLLGLEQGIAVGRNSAVDELIEKTLYNTYDERIQTFLLGLSLFDGFTLKQAQFVTREINADSYLDKLRRENAFVFYDEFTGTYKIHNILLDFLRSKHLDEAINKDLYGRAGEWHLMKKEYFKAYGYFYRAGETERIIALLDNEDTILNSAAFEGATELFVAMPRKLLFNYPLAYLQYIVILLVSGNPEEAGAGAERLDELEAFYKIEEEKHCRRKNRVLAEINIVRVMAVFNDIEKMKTCTAEAARYLEGGQCRMVRQEGEFSFGSPHFLYSYYREPGKLKQTAEFIAAEFPAFSSIANGCGTGCGYVALAEYALETGHLQAAELNAFKAIYKARHKGQTSIILCAAFTLARLYIYQGKITEALELLRQTKEETLKEDNAIYNTTLEIIDGYIGACLGRTEKIPGWLKTGDMTPASFMYQGLAFNYIVHGKAVLLSRDYLKLEMLTEEFLQYFGVFNNQLGFLHNRIMEASAKCALYGADEGGVVLKSALDMARADNIVLPFAEYAPAILEMVRLIARSDPSDIFVQTVFKCCKNYIGSLKSASSGHADVLSKRELEILAMAAKGLKRGEIAARLFLSVGTVQTHLHNIYIKLDVNGRAAAIYKAQSRKLI